MQVDTSPDFPELITVAAAARALKRDPRTVARWLCDPEAEGIVVVLAGRRYLRRDAFIQLVSGATPTPTDAENDR